jgi:hypothetical protein
LDEHTASIIFLKRKEVNPSETPIVTYQIAQCHDSGEQNMNRRNIALCLRLVLETCNVNVSALLSMQCSRIRLHRASYVIGTAN